MTDKNTPKRPRAKHPWLYALPHAHLPNTVACQGLRYRLRHTFKHDFFAATGLYEGPDGRLTVYKVGRETPALGIPLRWIGRFLARRELHLYRLTQDLPGVPALTGPVGQTGFMHAYVPGHPLARKEPVSDIFFSQLQTLVGKLHDRHIAYVDLNKRQNILMGDDGRPYLIDFQISLHLPPTTWRRFPPIRWCLQRFQHADRYHCLKHKRRLRPDLLTPDEQRDLAQLSVWIRLHRIVARPLIQLRRRILRSLQGKHDDNVPGSHAK